MLVVGNNHVLFECKEVSLIWIRVHKMPLMQSCSWLAFSRLQLLVHTIAWSRYKVPHGWDMQVQSVAFFFFACLLIIDCIANDGHSGHMLDDMAIMVMHGLLCHFSFLLA